MDEPPQTKPAVPSAAPGKMRLRPWTGLALLLTLALAYYVGGVVTLARHRCGEVIPITFARLLATGHMGEFVTTTAERRWPTDAWATAADWQRFSRLEDRGVLGRIAADAGQYEAHPPAFFWLLHAVLCLGVSDHWAATAINLPAAVITAVLVVAFAWWWTGDRWAAGLAGVCWCLSPPVMLIGDNVRSPTLFAPLTLLAVWLTLDWAARRDVRGHWQTLWRTSAMTLLAAAGMLNHYEMAVVLVACGIYLLWRRRDAVVGFVTAQVLAAGLFLLLHPHAFGSLAFNDEANANEPFTGRAELLRVGRVFVGVLHFLAMEPKWTRVVTLVVPVTLLGLACLPSVRQRWREHFAGRPAGVACLTLILVALATLLYVGRAVPIHAYGTYYFPGLIVLTPVWLGAGLAVLVRTWRTRGLLLGVLLTASVASMRQQLQMYHDAAAATAALAGADAILCDMPSIRGIPRVVADVPSATPVLVTTRARMLENAEALVDGHHRLVLALDRSAAKDALGDWVTRGLSAGALYEQPGLVPFSPEFVLYRTP